VQNFVDGKIAATIRSQPLPIQQGMVQVVVGLNYEEVVFDKSRDVLIEFSASWCGPCKQFEPEYKRLASLYMEQGKKDRVTIATIDAVENNIPDNEVTRFPTFKIYPAQDKTRSLTFSGAPNICSLIKFIETHGTHNVSVMLED
jgi:thiol-disulfide isomerase/thioredoxin